ncbi:MAG: phosphatase [Methylomonas sp.]|nr:MAG: phosphatase [Methylomonas sp.]
MLQKYDFHCHSTASDGALPPADVVRRAHLQGVTTLALTDHDTTAGLAEAAQAAAECGMRLIAGIELSANYANQCLHIVGLNIDAGHPLLVEGLLKQQTLRDQRAFKIAEKLEKKGIQGAYQAVTQVAGNGEITRSHFADFLVAQGHVATQQDAFDRYLSKGKPAFVSTQWASLDDVIGWIRAAGGIAVLAHPLRYNLSHKWMNRALTDFKVLGGHGVEVVTGRASVDDIRLSWQLAHKHQLFASVGSDFHNPENPWVELGRLAALPEGVQPVWSLFSSAE